jgi:hypothetical protein
MAEIVGGLFGVTPEALMAQREAALSQQATNFAQLSPMQSAQAGFYTAGNRLAGAAGGLLGAQDPEMMRIQQRQQMLQGLDLSSPESLKQGIQSAMQKRDYQLVSELTNRYQQSVAAGLKARETEANIAAKLGEKTTNEMKNAGGFADTVAQRGTPEWTAAYNEKLNELTTRPEKTLAYGAEAERLAKGAFGKGFNQLTQQEAAQVDAELEKRGLTKAKAGAAKTVLPAGEPEYLKEFGKGLAGKDLALRDIAEAAPAALDEVKLTRDLLESGKVFTGTGAGMKLNVLALGQSLGVTGGNADEVIANTQQLQQQRSKAVLNQIKTSGLGAGQGFTDKDLEFLQDASAGRITLSAETLRRQLALEEKAFKASAKKWNERVGKINPQFSAAMGLSPVSIETAPKQQGNKEGAPKPTKRYNPATGKIEAM